MTILMFFYLWMSCLSRKTRMSFAMFSTAFTDFTQVANVVRNRPASVINNMSVVFENVSCKSLRFSIDLWSSLAFRLRQLESPYYLAPVTRSSDSNFRRKNAFFWKPGGPEQPRLLTGKAATVKPVKAVEDIVKDIRILRERHEIHRVK